MNSHIVPLLAVNHLTLLAKGVNVFTKVSALLGVCSIRYAYRCHMLQQYSSSCGPNVASHDHDVTLSRDPRVSYDHSELFTTLLTTLIQLYSNTTW